MTRRTSPDAGWANVARSAPMGKVVSHLPADSRCGPAAARLRDAVASMGQGGAHESGAGRARRQARRRRHAGGVWLPVVTVLDVRGGGL